MEWEITPLHEQLSGIIGIAILGMLMILGYAFFQVYFVPDFESIENTGDSLTITECRYPFGSIFNKDSLKFWTSPKGQNSITIQKKSFLGDEKSTIPLSKIEKVIFNDGMYWKSFDIHLHGAFFDRDNELTIYYKKSETTDIIKTIMVAVAPDTIIEENQSIMKKIGFRIKKSDDPLKPNDPLNIR